MGKFLKPAFGLQAFANILQFVGRLRNSVATSRRHDLEAAHFRNLPLRFAYRIHDEQTTLLLDHPLTHCFWTTTHYRQV